jgi:hypothetical protein
MYNQAKSMLEGLLTKDEKKFEESFESFINNFAYDHLIAYEGTYATLFQFAMVLANQTYHLEQPTSDGRIDLTFSDPNQDDFVIEFKYLDLKSESKNKTYTTDDMAFMREKMENLSLEVEKQIDSTKYTSKFKQGYGKIYKVPLIIARHSDVFIKFVEEPNRTV